MWFLLADKMNSNESFSLRFTQINGKAGRKSFFATHDDCYAEGELVLGGEFSK